MESGFRKLVRRQTIGALLVEPIQARGGINLPPSGFLPMLRRLCDESGVLLVLDEIYTGFGRTGKWFACEHSGTVPDVICLGKALTGGFPMSACVGKSEVMDRAWPESDGEAIHTSTFLGHPVGCAMAIAQIKTITDEELVEHSAKLGTTLLADLSKIASEISKVRCKARGMGLMTGLELRDRNGKPATQLSLKVIKEMLKRGFVLLPEGEDANVISLTPPLTISSRQLTRTLKALVEQIEECQ